MTWLAVQTVHTTGVNLASVAAILGGFAAVAAVMMGWINRRTDRRDAEHQREIAQLRRDFTEGMASLAKILSARLETKDVVSAMNARLSRIEGTLERERQRLCQRSAWQ